MSLVERGQHYGIEGFTPPREEFVVPWSFVISSLVRSEHPPYAHEIAELTERTLAAFPSSELGLRGSTVQSLLLSAQGAQRERGILSAAATQFHEQHGEDTYRDQPRFVSQTAATILDLRFKTDFDLYLPGIGFKEFNEVQANIVSGLEASLGFSLDPYAAKAERFNGKFLAKSTLQVHSPFPQEIGEQSLFAQIEEGVVSGIPYGELILKTDSAYGRILGIFWTPGDVPKREIQDTRRDPRFALSWDAQATARIIREETHTGQFEMGEFENVWVSIDRQQFVTLARPMEVGRSFLKLPITEQMLLMLRAAQRGTAGEENLLLSRQGRRALKQSKIPAIHNSALQRFQKVNPYAFSEKYRQLEFRQKKAFRDEVWSYMFSGIFYLPQRFLQYAKEMNIFQFFPNLRDISSSEWDAIIANLPQDEEYERIQQHAYQTNGIFVDPYKLLVDGISKVRSDKINSKRGHLANCDYLFALDTTLEEEGMGGV